MVWGGGGGHQCVGGTYQGRGNRILNYKWKKEKVDEFNREGRKLTLKAFWKVTRRTNNVKLPKI